MRNKIKKITVCLLSILLITLIGFSFYSNAAIYENTSDVVTTTNDKNKTAAVLSDRYVLPYVARDMAAYNNLYCVKHSALLDNKPLIYQNTNIRAVAVAMAEIKGNNAKIYDVYTNSDNERVVELVGETTSSRNNVMAGIVTAEISKKYSGYTIYKGYGGLPYRTDGSWLRYMPDFTITQVAVHKYYNTWRETITEADFENPGFDKDTYSSLDVLTSKQTAANNLINDIKESTEIYSARIYYLRIKMGTNEWPDVQRLILVEPISKINIPVEKIWDDEIDTSNRKEITVKLLANGEDTGETIKLNSSNNWKNEFEELDQLDEDGNEITYGIAEVAVAGYTSSISGSQEDGFEITNQLITTNVKATKKWSDEIDTSNRTEITVELLDGETVISTAELNSENSWKYTFKDLPKFKNGKEVEYSVREKNIPTGYKNSGISGNQEDGYIITNELLITDIPVEKKWVDEIDTSNRTESITVKLYEKIGSGTKTDTGKTLTLNSSNDWKGTFEDLPEYKNGKEVIYTINESSVPTGYTESVDNTNYVITNTLNTIDIPVTKEWKDDLDTSNRPESITVKLYEKIGSGTKTDTGKTLTLNSSNDWKGTFEDLPEYKNGKEVIYTIKESSVPTGYTESVDNTNYVITNTLKTVEIPVTKLWYDDSNYDGERPTSITIKLYKEVDGKKTDTGKTITLDTSNNWKGTFTDLPEYESGKKIKYTVEETELPQEYEYESVITGNVEEGFTIGNVHEVQHPGYIEITGTVWHDKIIQGKVNSENGIYDDKDEKLGGIKVVLKDANGNSIQSTYTDENGKFTRTDYAITKADGTYTIRVNYDNSKNVYKLFDDVEKVEEKLKTAYVEFEYDAEKYTTVKTGTTGTETSKAKENETSRNTFDSKYGTITPSTEIDTIKNEKVTASTKEVISFEEYASKNESRTVTIRYCSGGTTHTRTNYKGAWLEPLTVDNNEFIHPSTCSKKEHILKEQNIEVKVIENINLGLLEREKVDVAIFEDISKVKVTMKGQEYTYLYGVRSNEKNNVGIKAKFEEKDTYIYKRPVNPADIAYINKVDNKSMSVEVTYEITVANLSTTLPVTIHNIDNYYDSRYTLITNGWKQEQKTDFKVAQYNGDLNIVLQPGAESEKIQLTYTIDQEAIKELLNEDATLNNAVEIQTYSIRYGENTVYAEQRTGGRTGKLYGGYDKDSHPGNANIALKAGEDGITRLYSTDSNGNIIPINQVEDDTDIAPSFVLCKDEEYYKQLSGNVWEDSDANPNDNYRLGDGKKADTDRNVENVKVELYKVNEDGTMEIAKLYYLDTDTAEIKEKDAITYTNKNGEYTFGDGKYSVTTDKYKIKFTYGGNEKTAIDGVNISARNYKSTIISKDSTLYPIFKGTSTDENWNLSISKGYSIAVDTIEERAAISDLQYSNFEDKISITAWSKPFIMQIEFDPKKESSVNLKDGIIKEDDQTIVNGITKFSNNLNIFDFGIIERAREDIFVETTTEYLKITLANGQVLVEGNPKDDILNYTKTMGLKQNIENGTSARNALEKQVITEIDAELLQGAQLEVKYALKVTNNSEKDIDYYVEEQYKTEYYYFGTNNEGSPEINNSINYVVDYLDSELTYAWEDAESWKQITAEELLNEGFISKKTHDKIKENGYDSYITTKFNNLKSGETKTDYITANKVLSNQDENVYDNHIEILQIDTKIARTDKQTGGIKEYKMGNYVPSLATRQISTNINLEKTGLHEQDDDRIKIVITPPTGDTKHITPYVITVGIGLILIAVIAIFIKKKVLAK